MNMTTSASTMWDHQPSSGGGTVGVGGSSGHAALGALDPSSMATTGDSLWGGHNTSSVIARPATVLGNASSTGWGMAPPLMGQNIKTPQANNAPLWGTKPNPVQQSQQQQQQSSTSNGWGDLPSSSGPSMASGGWNQSSGPSTQQWGGTPGQQSQWDASQATTVSSGTTSGGSSSWSQIASKNVVQAQQQQQSTGASSTGGHHGHSQQQSQPNPASGHLPTPITGRGAGGAPPSGGTTGWGSHPVDQGTPWTQISGQQLQQQQTPDAGPRRDWSHQSSSASSAPSGWGEAPSGHVGGGGDSSGWNQAPPTNNRHHQQQHPPNDSYWRSGNGQQQQLHAPQRQGSTGSSGGLWGGPLESQQPSQHHITSGSGWDSLPPQTSRQWNAAESNMSNVWTGPPADTVVDSSMVWNNPNPKKVAQPDRGTNCWGDPNSQQEIRRWKPSACDENIVTGGAAVALAAAAANSNQAATNITSTSGALPAGNVSNSVWKETPMAPQPLKQTSNTGSTATSALHTWNLDVASTVSAAAPLKSSASTPVVQNVTGGGSSGGNVAGSQDVTGTTLWETVAKVGGGTTGVAVPSWPPQDNSSTGWDQSATKKFVTDSSTDLFLPRMTPINGLPKTVLPKTDLQQGSLNAKILQDLNAALNAQQQEATSSKYFDQLKNALSSGLIFDKTLPDGRLNSEQTASRLQCLLQCIPKLDQAQRELHQLTQAAEEAKARNQPITEAQQHEARRLQTEIFQFHTMMNQLKAELSAFASSNQQQRGKSGSIPPENDSISSSLDRQPSETTTASSVGSVATTPADSLNQSKLLQWKNANGSPSTSILTSNGAVQSLDDKCKQQQQQQQQTFTASSPSGANLESLVQSLASAQFSLGGGDSQNSTGDLWTNSDQQQQIINTTKDSVWPPRVGQKSDDKEGSTSTDSQASNDSKDSMNNNQNAAANGSQSQPMLVTSQSQSEDSLQRPNVHGHQYRDSQDLSGFGRTADEGPPEFRPGQKWLWKDPKEMAEDPNATPGSIKPNSLTLNTNLSFLAANSGSFGQSSSVVQNLFNTAPGNFSTFQQQAQSLIQQQHQQQGHLGAAGPVGTTGGFPGCHGAPPPHHGSNVSNPLMQHHHSFSGTTSLFGGPQPNPKILDDYKMKPTVDFLGPSSRMGTAAGPPPLIRPLATQPLLAGGLGTPQNTATPFVAASGRPPLIKPQFSAPNAFVPYATAAPHHQQWVLLTITSVSHVDEHTLQMVVGNVGPTLSYISPPGSGLAFLKFRDVPFERALAKLKHEFTPLGVNVQTVSESDVERVLQRYNVRLGPPPPPPPFVMPGQQPPPPGVPPPRHPPTLWDAPPPMGAPTAPWAQGPPPPLGATGPHHHGPPPPIHGPPHGPPPPHHPPPPYGAPLPLTGAGGPDQHPFDTLGGTGNLLDRHLF